MTPALGTFRFLNFGPAKSTILFRTLDCIWKKVWVKLGRWSWEKPERFLNTEEPRPALISISARATKRGHPLRLPLLLFLRHMVQPVQPLQRPPVGAWELSCHPVHGFFNCAIPRGLIRWVTVWGNFPTFGC